MAGLRSFPEACLGKMLSFIKFCYQVHHIGGRIQFFPALSVCVCTLSPFSCVRLFATLWAVAHQAPLSVLFPKQEYWSGLLFPSPGDLPDPGIKPGSPALQADALLSDLLGKPYSV